ncbi:hypothetical protein [Antrihabitans sp. YC2-6]|uniref:hypothetical protein n=1 Tax=Antrihabitans sp. YC2-6 TaxID=2799498 RepID=UPI0018F67C6E|nr:hypothetical protein [Antrihabitans sp. YC2-6]MBJ8348917.1 hypothetical protein [Antrihabitans sp. YC2-6]
MATPGQVRNWDVSGLQSVADRATQIADVVFASAGKMHSTIHDDLVWQGDARIAACDAADREQAQMRAIAVAYDHLAAAYSGAGRDMTYPLAEIKAILRNYVAPPVTVADDWTVSGVDDWDSEAGLALLRLSGLVSSLLTADSEWGTKINAANDELAAMAPTAAIDSARTQIEQDKARDRRTDPVRMRTSAAAFQQAFGRPPLTSTDWATAEALNPHSFDPKYQNVDPAIKVVRIQPVPGQGVVRAGQFIEQADVTNPFMGGDSANPFARNRGDSRGPDANFDPEHTRVTTYVDYENGIVVMRQNPSVVQNSDGTPGEVQVGTPEGSVWQSQSGAVRIQYDAADPFEPEAAKRAGFTVNGDLVFTPGPNGVHVDGTRTDYPSLEVYQDRPDSAVRTVVIDRATEGHSLGTLDLINHHDLGLGDVAFRPWAQSWNYEYDVPGSFLPGTGFGTPGNAPTAAIPDEPVHTGPMI